MKSTHLFRFTKIITILLVGFLLQSCSSTPKQKDMKLYDLWVLIEFNQEVLKTTDFPDGLPRLEFNLAENRLTGFAGCNEIMGAIQIEGNQIHFEKMTSTRMMCPNLSFEQKLISTLNEQDFTYEIEEGKLLLTGKKNAVLKLRKID